MRANNFPYDALSPLLMEFLNPVMLFLCKSPCHHLCNASVPYKHVTYHRRSGKFQVLVFDERLFTLCYVQDTRVGAFVAASAMYDPRLRCRHFLHAWLDQMHDEEACAAWVERVAHRSFSDIVRYKVVRYVKTPQYVYPPGATTWLEAVCREKRALEEASPASNTPNRMYTT